MLKAALLLAFALAFVPSASAEAKPAKKPDVLIFTNGDQLSGTILRAAGGNVVFKSDMAGELTISFDKIRELRSGSDVSQFALLPKHVPARQQKAVAPEGTLAYSDGFVTITPVAAAPLTVKPADIAYLIDKPTYDKAVAHKAGPLTGWNGTITAGATVVRSSQNATTLTGGIALVRAIPTVPYLPLRNRTLINATESYGTLTTIAPPPPSATLKTSIFHGEFERDEYFSPRFYALADATFDHNLAQLVDLQQIYGVGVGWTAIKGAKQQFDVKADVHYEREQFLAAEYPSTPAPAAPSISLFGSTFAQNYIQTLPHKMVFTESGTYIPSWTTLNAYSANFSAALAAPVFKRLSLSVSTVDGYINNVPSGARRNSFQFITGITYSLH